MTVTICPSAAKPHASVAAPPGKSMAHRLLICAGQAIGEQTVHGVALSEDVLAAIDCLRALGVKCVSRGVEAELYQSNHEGDLVDKIQAAYGNTDGIVINPGAYTHTSIALLDALRAVGIPTVAVHISDLSKREDFRQRSYIRAACVAVISGHGLDGYTEAMALLLDGKAP